MTPLILLLTLSSSWSSTARRIKGQDVIREAKKLDATEEQGATCSVPNGQKKDCGAMGMQQQQCEAKGCCWQEAPPGTPWCFHKTNGASVNTTDPDHVPHALRVLADRRKFGEIYCCPNINHVAAFIVVQPKDPTAPVTTILQKPGQYQTLGGYKAPQPLPYKTAALRSEMYDEGNIVVTEDNLIRASPLYIKASKGPGQKGPVLLQVFYLREGPWMSQMGSWEFGRRPNGRDPGQVNKMVHAVPLEKNGQGIETYLRPFRPVDIASWKWLKDAGVIENIQSEEKASSLWNDGVLQTFDNFLKEGHGWFQRLQNALAKPGLKDDFKYVITSPWKAPRKGKMIQLLLR